MTHEDTTTIPKIDAGRYLHRGVEALGPGGTRTQLLLMAQAIEYAAGLEDGQLRRTLIPCRRRPGNRPCAGLLSVVRAFDELIVYCPICESLELTLVNWEKTPFAGGPAAAVHLERRGEAVLFPMNPNHQVRFVGIAPASAPSHPRAAASAHSSPNQLGLSFSDAAPAAKPQAGPPAPLSAADALLQKQLDALGSSLRATTLRELIAHAAMPVQIIQAVTESLVEPRTQERLTRAVELATEAWNDTPRAELGGRTPDEVFRDPPAPPLRSTSVGRNEPCPCGSGKKYKRCCGR